MTTNMAAATRVIVKQGLSAPTALIAKEAGVANGSFIFYPQESICIQNQIH